MQRLRAEDNEARWKGGIYGRWLPERYGCALLRLPMHCFRESQESHCGYLSAEEFHLEFVQDFPVRLQVTTIPLMLVLLGKL
jgi:hypothetical protein